MKKRTFTSLLSVIGISMIFIACSNNQKSPSSTDEKKKSDDQTLTIGDKLTQERLRRFDSLDFDFYSHQKWDSLIISHDPGIKVYYPDGTTTTGLLPQHVDMLKPMFVFAPDTKITSHPIKFGSGDWTTVVGELEGTFTKPMVIGNGKTIPPTGKKFKLSMCTVGHWKGGKMIEEYLFWDNMLLMKQMGLAQ